MPSCSSCPPSPAAAVPARERVRPHQHRVPDGVVVYRRAGLGDIRRQTGQSSAVRDRRAWPHRAMSPRYLGRKPRMHRNRVLLPAPLAQALPPAAPAPPGRSRSAAPAAARRRRTAPLRQWTRRPPPVAMRYRNSGAPTKAVRMPSGSSPVVTSRAMSSTASRNAAPNSAGGISRR